MSISYHLDRAENLTTFTLSGEVSYREFLSTLNAYGEEGPTVFELYDARGLTGERLTTGELHTFASYLSRHADSRPAGGRTAVLVADELDYGISRMLSLLIEDTTTYDVEVFHDLDAARRWLASGSSEPEPPDSDDPEDGRRQPGKDVSSGGS